MPATALQPRRVYRSAFLWLVIPLHCPPLQWWKENACSGVWGSCLFGWKVSCVSVFWSLTECLSQDVYTLASGTPSLACSLSRRKLATKWGRRLWKPCTWRYCQSSVTGAGSTCVHGGLYAPGLCLWTCRACRGYRRRLVCSEKCKSSPPEQLHSPARVVGFPAGSDHQNLPAGWETQALSLGWEDPLEEDMAIHSSILAWKIPWTDEAGGLQSMGSQRAGFDSATNTHTHQGGSQGDGIWIIWKPHEWT